MAPYSLLLLLFYILKQVPNFFSCLWTLVFGTANNTKLAFCQIWSIPYMLKCV